jgi:hypothetical protein
MEYNPVNKQWGDSKKTEYLIGGLEVCWIGPANI